MSLVALASTLALYSLSMNYNISYEWHLRQGEAILVVPAGYGAYIACSSYRGLAVHVGVGDAAGSAVNASDALLGVSLGASEGHVLLLASADVSFLLHVRFVRYAAGEQPRVVAAPDAPPVDFAADAARATDAELAGAAPGADGAAARWAPLVLSLLVAVCMAVLIIRGVIRRNHGPYEEMAISDDEGLDGYIPAVIAPLPERNYVACVLGNESVREVNREP
jgi:hypothetical protein